MILKHSVKTIDAVYSAVCLINTDLISWQSLKRSRCASTEGHGEGKEHGSLCSTAGNVQQRAQIAHSMHTGLFLQDCVPACVSMISAPPEVVHKPCSKPCACSQHRGGKLRAALQTDSLISFKTSTMFNVTWRHLKTMFIFSLV